MLLCKDASNAVRWTRGETLSDLFEARCDTLSAEGREQHPAIDTIEDPVSFAELEHRANRFAHCLEARGLRAGARVGLLLDKSANAYAVWLAVMKIGAAFVPLDASYPPDRIGFIHQDAGLSALIVAPAYREAVASLGVSVLRLEELCGEAQRFPAKRFERSEREDDGLAYIVYTSGSTGNPKGVAVAHSSICNFVRVAGEVYRVGPGDRMYQGLTFAFDFSTEEIWVPLIAGATLVPAPTDATLVGRDLGRFLVDRGITALCCVPTLLQTVTTDVPRLRFLLVSGEACPYDLVERWTRPGRRMLNAYGPTEATVTASWTELVPGRPVTIGVPLPTYAVLILEEGGLTERPDGEVGEICIAGPGVALGYVNRPEATASSFIEAPFPIADTSARIYRTGDLGRIGAHGEIEYLGRMDTQVKIRGYRIELTEIESVLLACPGVAQAVVATVEIERGIKELAAYVTEAPGASKIDTAEIARTLRSRLPGYMCPAYVEILSEVPMSASNKADRKRLPPPSGRRLSAARGEFTAPRTPTEECVAATLAKTLGVPAVSTTDDIFDDLGGHSFLMMEFVLALQDVLPESEISIRDVYLNRTVEKFSRAIDAAAQRSGETEVPEVAVADVSRLQHALCGIAQYLYYVATGFAYLWAGLAAYRWQEEAATLADFYLRSVMIASLGLGVSVLVPVAAKWLIIGSWKAERIPLWSWRYFRFWVVKQLIQTSPMALFAGQPIYNAYLRLLGARVGKHAFVAPRFVPVCTDLLTIGDHAVLARECLVQTYKAERGWLITGPVEIGPNSYIGELTLLDIDTHIGAGVEVAHASSVQSGQRLEAGGRYWGSPAVRAPHTSRPRCEVPAHVLRPGLFTVMTLLVLVTLVLPLAEFVLVEVASLTLESHMSYAADPARLSDLKTLVRVAWEDFWGSSATFAAAWIFGLFTVRYVPRICARALQEGKVYPLYGYKHSLASLSAIAGNSRFFNVAFGDSALITSYLKWVGLELDPVVQTGSNFGTTQDQDIPHLCRIGSGTMVSDGLSIINIRQTSTAFEIVRAEIGEASFLGNQVVYIGGARLGAGNLLGTKVHVPLAGPVLENAGLMGSPPFQIPRSVVTKRSFDPLTRTPGTERTLAAKARHNGRTLVLYLLLVWGGIFGSLFVSDLALMSYAAWGPHALLPIAALAPVVGTLYFIAGERIGRAHVALKPTDCTIHEPEFWEIERYWKLGESPLKGLFKGTPFRALVSRTLGARVGRMVFDDGCVITEKELTEIGDFCCLNEATSLQAHSLEDGLYKSGPIVLKSWATLGPASYVNYGVELGERALLLADSFLLKGSIVASSQTWGGNPAQRKR